MSTRMHAIIYAVQPRTQAALVTVFSTQLDLLHRYYIVSFFRYLHSEKTEQILCTIVLPVDGPVRPELVRCNTVTLTKLCIFNKVIYSPTNTQVNCLKNNIKIDIKIITHRCAIINFFFLWRCGQTRAMTSSFLRFLDHTD